MISNQLTGIKKKSRIESVLIALILLSSDKKYKLSHWSDTQKNFLLLFWHYIVKFSWCKLKGIYRIQW